MVLLVPLVVVLALTTLDNVSATNKKQRLLSFVIEQDWNENMAFGSGGKCTSGGYNHAQILLASFLRIARFAAFPQVSLLFYHRPFITIFI